ncbi:potassium channel subfamily K member 1 [Cryptotermes secundus]|uniref:potassium channel subfamily K member 1 n=1 Tax=Cryptotermes secundus TaxID=105785 RepID=UPI000CD7C047|nr:potassium channel subfamily K member 1 [Cryptotermes secundus]
MNGDNKKKLESESSSSPSLWSRLRSALGHVGLFLTLMIYTAVGGMVFNELESPAEVSLLQELQTSVLKERRFLIHTIVNHTINSGHDHSEQFHNLTSFVSHKLGEYEEVVQEAVRGGVTLPLNPNTPVPMPARWNFLQAVFFASTVLTTIGYGNIVPATFGGRAFCILFALVGIPLTLSVIASMGHIFATAVSSLHARMRKHLPPAPAVFLSVNTAARRSLTAAAAVVFLFLYLAAGAGLFMLWEEDWSFFEGFYFCFVTMTTIGFGDLVPKKPKYMLLCTLYILVGLALTSTIIELVRRQYAQSWRRLQALSGPLADTLRRLGESAGGGIDVTALQKMLTIVSVPRRVQSGESGAKERREWEEAMAAVLRDIASSPKKQPPPVVQIVIYESSV